MAVEILFVCPFCHSEERGIYFLVVRCFDKLSMTGVNGGVNKKIVANSGAATFEKLVPMFF